MREQAEPAWSINVIKICLNSSSFAEQWQTLSHFTLTCPQKMDCPIFEHIIPHSDRFHTSFHTQVVPQIVSTGTASQVALRPPNAQALICAHARLGDADAAFAFLGSLETPGAPIPAARRDGWGVGWCGWGKHQKH